MNATLDDLIENYYKWLKDKTILKQLEGSCEITTPFLDRHNDYIQIYAIKHNDRYKLTDDGYTIDDLLSSGCSLESPKRQKMLKVILNGYGIELEDNKKLITNTTFSDFPIKKHNLIQSIIDVNNMFFLANSTVESLFYEDVKLWFDDIDVRYSERIPFTGKSGYSRTFDFVIPKSKRSPERLIKTLNNPSKQNADSIIFDWLDIEGSRPDDSLPIVLINNEEKSISNSVIESFTNYNMEAVKWTDKDKIKEKLAA